MYVGDIAAELPFSPAVTMARSRETRDYAELDKRSNQFAQLFRGHGLASGDHVAILIENRLEFFDVLLGAHRSGLHYTTINTHLTAGEIDYIVADSGARALVTSSALAPTAALAPATKRILRIDIDGGSDGYEDVSALIGSLPGTPIGDELAGSAMLYSSGTTGRPKGVKFPLSGLHPRTPDPFAQEFVGLFGIDSRTNLLLPGPLYHTSPLFYADMVLRLGGRLVVQERFDAEETLRTIEDLGVTHSFFVPTMLLRMLRLSDEVKQHYDLSSHVWSLTGAAPCAPEIKSDIAEWWGPILWEGYAGSERNGMTILTPREAQTHTDSVGRPVGCGIEVVDADHEPVEDGQTGLVYFTGGHQFEYHNDPDKTREAFLRPHVSTLGDIGHVDSDGFLYLTDRAANVIIAGGVNIYPQESEIALSLHPLVEDVAVIGVPHEEFGEVPHAVVQLRKGTAGTADLAAELIAYCQQKLAKFKSPRSVEFVDALPRLPNGKLVKRLIEPKTADNAKD